MIIKKFGGSSVGTPARIRSILDLLQGADGKNTALVFSAFGGVTDQLIAMSTLAWEGQQQYRLLLAEVEARHLEAVRELLPVTGQSPVLANLKVMLNELEDVLQGVFLVRERTARTLDYVMSFGERLSAYILAEALAGRGVPARFLDARTVIRTNDQFGRAQVDFGTTNQLIRTHFSQGDWIRVITGFIASTTQGETTTLGRSGSDYTAAIFAGALKASSLEIWTDVDGMMTADPRKVPSAFTVPEMSYQEAMELSHFGAKVIFPATMQPAMASGIPIVVKNTFNPAHPGTTIHNQAQPGRGIIKGISSMDAVSLINVQGSGLLGVVGVSMRLFRALAEAKVNVILISQASSEHSICLAVETPSAPEAQRAIRQEFAWEMQNNAMDDVQVENNLSILAIVGEGMKHNPGTSGRMFHALGKNGINVHAIAQGSSELNISAVVRQADIRKALNVLHESFFLSDRKVMNVFLLGTGLIGKALLHMVEGESQRLQRDHHLEIRIKALANSKRMLFAGNGQSLTVDQMLSEGEPMRMTAFSEKMIQANLPNSVLVDCTSSEEVTDFYPVILAANISIVTPNKKANSGSLGKYQMLKQAAARRGVRFLYETNVGAGLPVINTLNDLLLSGDKIIRIEAVLSGTMNFIFSSFAQGTSFSEIVAEAKAKGYTEPDPRDDLNGLDVARKLLILARECGMKMEIQQIETENVVPEPCRNLPDVAEFMNELKKFDGYFDEQRARAEAAGHKLRYMAVLEKNHARVRLQGVDDQHPFYSLSGSDNIILL
nr:bifunctional aspartate kinase/homoserine dehydrogenase I [Cyclobacteriaceae bacterium]